MKMNESTYLAIKDLLQKWYGLANDSANLQVLVGITELVEKDFSEQAEGGEDAKC